MTNFLAFLSPFAKKKLIFVGMIASYNFWIRPIGYEMNLSNDQFCLDII